MEPIAAKFLAKMGPKLFGDLNQKSEFISFSGIEFSNSHKKNRGKIWFADYIANPLDYHVIILCETDLLFNKLYLQICTITFYRAFTKSTLILC